MNEVLRAERRRYLASLAKGWWSSYGRTPSPSPEDEEGEPISSLTLNQLDAFLSICPEVIAEHLAFWPVQDGSVSAEYSSAEEVFSLEFTVSGEIELFYLPPNEKNGIQEETRDLQVALAFALKHHPYSLEKAA